MEKVKEIATGKAKSMFTTNNPDELIMEFRDDASAFDGKKRASLAGKGAVNNQFNAFIMNYLGGNGIEHHLIDLMDNTHSLVHSLDMFPIECVIRNRATGSICRRLGTEDGLILEKPLFFVCQCYNQLLLLHFFPNVLCQNNHLFLVKTSQLFLLVKILLGLLLFDMHFYFSIL